VPGERHQGATPAREPGLPGCEVHGKRAGGEGKKRNDRAAGAIARSVPASDEPVDELPPEFTEMAAQHPGVSQRVVQKDLKVADALSPEDLRLLDERGAGKTEVERLAAIPDEARRRQAVSLVAAGMSPKGALAYAALPADTQVVTVGDPSQPQPSETDMTDEEWLETYCGEVLARLKYTAVYKRDAILYRKTRDARERFRNATKADLSQSKIQPTGPFFWALARVVNIDHPRNWLPCGPCGGTGMSGDVGKCGNCYGHAYVVKTGGRTSQRY
jgi:hypothetical protein